MAAFDWQGMTSYLCSIVTSKEIHTENEIRCMEGSRCGALSQQRLLDLMKPAYDQRQRDEPLELSAFSKPDQ